MRWLTGLFRKQEGDEDSETLQNSSATYLPEHIDEPAFLRHIDTGRKIDSVDESMEFWLSNGETITSMEELALAFTRMRQEHFLQQATREKNEFADWLEDAFGEKTIAGRIRKTLSKEKTKNILLTHLKQKHKDKTEELFMALLEKAKKELSKGNPHKAESTMKQLKSLLSLNIIREEDRRQLEYALKELSIDITLATL